MELSGQLGGTHGEHIREVDQDAVPLAWELETEALGGLQGVVQDLPPHPEPCTASTTTTASESAAMVRLRAGKLWRRGDVPSGNWLTSAPPAARISSARRKCAAG